MAVANKAAKALQDVYGTKFDVGPSPELLCRCFSNDFKFMLMNGITLK